MYVKTTIPKDKIGVYGFWSLIVLLALIYVINLAGPPPPDADSIGWAGLLLWLFVLWAYWADKHRIAKSGK